MFKKKISFFVVFSISSVLFCESLFTGDGRKDLSLQVEPPALQNIGTDSAWIPDFVVNSISDDIRKYSNIQVSDVYNAKKIAAAQKKDESGIFDDSDLVEAGNFVVAKNVLLVSITQKPSNYAISVRINDKEKNTSIAAFNEPNCPYADLESGLVLKQAVADLLEQLDVSLTPEGKLRLLAVKSTAGAASIEAQKLVAFGNVAEQSGYKIEALSYYIQANTSDSSLQRAKESMAQASIAIAGGEIGNYARNAIRQRKQFIKLIEDFKKNCEKQIPAMLVYNPNFELGNIDYKSETVVIKIKIGIVKDIEKLYLWKNIVNAVKSAPDSENWGLDFSLPCYLGRVGMTLRLSDKKGRELGKLVLDDYENGEPEDWYNRKRIEVAWGDGEEWTSAPKRISGYAGFLEFSKTELITIPAEADTSNLVLSATDFKDVKYDRPEKNIQMRVMPRDLYMKEVFHKFYDNNFVKVTLDEHRYSLASPLGFGYLYNNALNPIDRRRKNYQLLPELNDFPKLIVDLFQGILSYDAACELNEGHTIVLTKRNKVIP